MKQTKTTSKDPPPYMVPPTSINAATGNHQPSGTRKIQDPFRQGLEYPPCALFLRRSRLPRPRPGSAGSPQSPHSLHCPWTRASCAGGAGGTTKEVRPPVERCCLLQRRRPPGYPPPASRPPRAFASVSSFPWLVRFKHRAGPRPLMETVEMMPFVVSEKSKRCAATFFFFSRIVPDALLARKKIKELLVCIPCLACHRGSCCNFSRLGNTVDCSDSAACGPWKASSRESFDFRPFTRCHLVAPLCAIPVAGRGSPNATPASLCGLHKESCPSH